MLIPAPDGTPTSDTPTAYFIHETTTSLLLVSLDFIVPEIIIEVTMPRYVPIFMDYHTNDPIHQDIKALLHVYIVERTHLHNVQAKIVLVPVFLLHGPNMIK
jgi:serine kinase of HPr protein (carbohydrate metabolism regulator)